MTLIKNHKLLKVNVLQFDQEHEQIVAIVNQMNADFKSGNLHQNFQAVMHQISGLLRDHFKAEEEMLANHNYPGLEEHCQKHIEIIEQVSTFETAAHNGNSMQMLTLMQFMLNLLAIHTKTVDSLYGPFLNSKGVF